MNKEKTLKEIGDLAYSYEQKFGGCSQCVVAAAKDTLGNIGDDVFKAATGLAGGIGLSGNNCGAFTGAVMVLSTYLGRDINNFADPEKTRFETFRIVRKLIERYEAEYGSVNCRDIQTKVMGRYFNLWDKKEFEEFIEAGGHDDKCPSVCRNAAKWTAEILMDENLI